MTDAAPAGVMELAQNLLRVALGDPPVGRATPASVREALERLCDRAHADGLRAEQLILRLKAAWWELPEVRYLAREYETLVLARVISLCIAEYFAPWRGTRS